MADPSICCPTCGASSVRSRGKRHAVYPAGCLYLIGLPLALLHQLSGPMLYRCQDCRHEFGKRTFLAKAALGILITIPVLWIVAVVLIATGAI